MQKLINYINNIGIPADCIHPETVGSDYFKNTSIHIKRVTLFFDYNTYDAHETSNQQELIENYCNLNGYKITSRGAFQYTGYFTVYNVADFEALESYYIHENRSREDCEKIITDYTRTGRRSSHPAELEKALKDIMQQHENNYKSYLKAIAS